MRRSWPSSSRVMRRTFSNRRAIRTSALEGSLVFSTTSVTGPSFSGQGLTDQPSDSILELNTRRKLLQAEREEFAVLFPEIPRNVGIDEQGRPNRGATVQAEIRQWVGHHRPQVMLLLGV